MLDRRGFLSLFAKGAATGVALATMPEVIRYAPELFNLPLAPSAVRAGVPLGVQQLTAEMLRLIKLKLPLIGGSIAPAEFEQFAGCDHRMYAESEITVKRHLEPMAGALADRISQWKGFAPLSIPEGVEAAAVCTDPAGFSLRGVYQYDHAEDLVYLRFDVAGR